MVTKTEIYSAHQLDAIDIAILRELQKDARITIKELAQKVNLSTTPVFERWRKLETLGYISDYVTVLEPEKLGLGLMVYCMVKLQRLNYSVAEKFVRTITRLPEVSECYNVSGSCDYMLKITVPDMKAYRHFILNVLGHLEPVGYVESHFVMDVVKRTFELPLE